MGPRTENFAGRRQAEDERGAEVRGVRMLKRLFRRRDDDERGAALVLTALSVVLLLWAGTTGVDVGFSVYGSREAQAIADTAALDLARYISYADTLSSISAVQTYLNTKLSQVLTDNGSNASLSVVPGYYNSSTGKFTADGFTGKSCQPVIDPPINQPGCNAIEVRANQSVPQVFFGGFNFLTSHAGNTVTGSVSGSSIATQTPYAGFSIGTYLLNLNGQQSGALNALFGDLGTPVNLPAVDYEDLATANVTVAQLINARPDLLSATNVMTANLSAAQWLSVYENAVGGEYGTGSTAYSTLQALDFSGSSSTDVKLCQLANINIGSSQYDCNNSSLPALGFDASVNVLQMLNTEAELANGTNGIDVTSALNLNSALAGVSGLSVANVMLSTVLKGPAQVAYGPVGTTVTDAQVQTTLSMNLTQSGASLGTLSVPLSAATGTATLSSVTCSDYSLYNEAIAPVSTGAISSGTNGVTLTLQGNTTAQGTFSISALSNKSVTFTGPANPAGSVIPPTSSTESAGTNPESVGSTTPTLTFTAASGANSDVTDTMGVLATAYGPVLQAVGLTVGGATVAGLSDNCGTVALVQ